jgi:hypothetical protein
LLKLGLKSCILKIFGPDAEGKHDGIGEESDSLSAESSSRCCSYKQDGKGFQSKFSLEIGACHEESFGFNLVTVPDDCDAAEKAAHSFLDVLGLN